MTPSVMIYDRAIGSATEDIAPLNYNSQNRPLPDHGMLNFYHGFFIVLNIFFTFLLFLIFLDILVSQYYCSLYSL